MKIARILLAVCLSSLITLLPAGAEITQQAFIKGSNTGLGRNFGPGDQFGGAVAISGDTMVVGATLEASKATGINPGPEAEKDNSGFFTGAAYVFRRKDGQWKQEAYLKASDALTAQRFGTAVAISGDTIVVGASGGLGPFGGRQEGAAYVFVRSGDTWTEQTKLPATVPYSGGVSIDGDTLAIGHSWFNQETVTRENEAHVYVRANGAWLRQAAIKASQNSAISVAVSGDNLVVGGSNGAAFHRRTGSSWTQSSIFPEVAQPGLIVAISGNTAVTSSNMTEAVTHFEREGDAWVKKGEIKEPELDPKLFFGTDLELEGDRLVVGATSYNDRGGSGTGPVRCNAFLDQKYRL